MCGLGLGLCSNLTSHKLSSVGNPTKNTSTRFPRTLRLYNSRGGGVSLTFSFSANFGSRNGSYPYAMMRCWSHARHEFCIPNHITRLRDVSAWLGHHGNLRHTCRWTCWWCHLNSKLRSTNGLKKSFFLSFFLGFRRPNLITGPSGWRAPDSPLKIQEPVPDWRTGALANLCQTQTDPQQVGKTDRNVGGLACILGLTNSHNQSPRLQPVPWKMRLEMVKEMQIETLNGLEILVN